LALIVEVIFFAGLVLCVAPVCAESDFDGTISSNNTLTDPTVTPIPPTPTPCPTPPPNTKITPGSPLSLGSSTFAETIAEFDIMNLAKLVVIALCIMWVVIILVSVDKKFGKEEPEKQ
jgi:hypothetical protein